MKKRINFSALFTNYLLVALLVAFAFPAVGPASLVLFAIPVLRIFVSGEIVIGAFGVQQEIWIADIQENLYENNEFMTHSVDHSSYVQYRTVHVPQAGSNPAVQVDRSVLPATISKRTDTDLSYTIQEFTTDPTTVGDFEDLQLSYSKRQSVLGQHYNTLSQSIGTRLSYNWAPAAALTTRITRTTGAADGTALAPGATGTRKRLLLADIQIAAARLDKDLAPEKGRFLLLPVDMYYQLFPPAGSSDVGFMSASSFVMGQTIIPNGKIPMLYGFNILVKPTVVVYDTSAEKKLPTAATAVTDHLAALYWQQGFVTRAEGSIKAFPDENRAEYYGSIWSAMVPFGGTALRTAWTGVGAIVQTT